MSELSPASRLQRILAEQERRRRYRQLDTLYPETGPLRRELYGKHLAFFRAGASYRERCMLAANRVGKSFGIGGYEMTLHLTGLYPAWWIGRRFRHPIKAWAAGKTGTTTRDIIQAILLGAVGEMGTGLVPKECIGRSRPRQGVADAIETVKVKHYTDGVFDGWSDLGLKSCDQKRRAFEGTARHVVWFDEEPPLDVYTEGLMRTMTTDGIVICTFTPLDGISDVVLKFLPGGRIPTDA